MTPTPDRQGYELTVRSFLDYTIRNGTSGVRLRRFCGAEPDAGASMTAGGGLGGEMRGVKSRGLREESILAQVEVQAEACSGRRWSLVGGASLVGGTLLIGG